MKELERAVINEYGNLMKEEKLLRDNLSELPFGYLQKKIIKGKEYFYLQHRDGRKVKSKYVKKNELSETMEKVAKRKEIENRLGEIKEEQHALEGIIEKDLLQVLVIKQAVLKVIANYKGIKRVVLFGSRAEGRYRDDSDVDLLFETRGPMSLMTQTEIRLKLEEELGLSVDLVHGPLNEDSFLEINKEVEMYVA